MPPTPADQELLANMRQREFQIKKRQRASNAIAHETGRYRIVLLVGAAILVALLATGLVIAVDDSTPDWPDVWRRAVLVPVLGAICGVLIAQNLLRTPRGQKVFLDKEERLRDKYSGDLHAGRRWLQFFYDGEDISAYVPQILYLIEGERRFDSVAEALAFLKDHERPDAPSDARDLEAFDAVVAEADLIVVSSVDESGRPSSRLMRFVTTDRPGVWYVTTAPEGPKVAEFDRGRVAVVTMPTETGATVSSNQVRIRRSAETFPAIADLYRAQVPGYLDGMTEEDQQRELVYELILESARVDTWLDHESVVFCAPGEVGH